MIRKRFTPTDLSQLELHFHTNTADMNGKEVLRATAVALSVSPPTIA
jgi:hypothetical protein